ncbi:4-(cytidine 5'-diphospho)-2-C-methyl-D-erythritol kinase [Leadbettera azotonutricia]|uniref:4-diphosphocytidyl-2-C-methyl-D-erythritol kinase n=1 Tax=Leadbettera azotonutricia (strain ATCC BAA-888 / DSM 13862 / ZAS-9) TaxID=545695 RepID=F5Y7D1_LEAAZ|nr:4-(cytidine 5'-diphospho)-2-C-methyl-D-erythritol kinase [Leadbettera azotonutricia]AEF81399.1 4-(cytidine 5'-diphospho)-2-C-methyl-D-erythritol kinase [Leadbettera azotonutricia ZAS-9]
MKNLVSCSIQAPCKINLHLMVGEKRPDGYHDLQSIFAALDYSDTLTFEIVSCNGSFVQHWEVPFEEDCAIPPGQNLVNKALGLFREKTGFAAHLSIHVVKRIPAGAGLGGGSSDAASTLLALNALSGANLAKAELLEMAASLGSDVPFFLNGGAAWASGRGEHLEPLPCPKDLWVLLAKPPFASPTAEAYGLLDESRETGRLEAGEYPPHKPGRLLSPRDLGDVLAGPPEKWPFYNDFLPILSENREYLRLLEKLAISGSAFSGLSGSGSCCFGIFREKETAQKAQKALLNRKIFTELTFFLAKFAEPVLK